MNLEEIREYCLAKPGVTEGFPFNDIALVFKVGGKMFALLDLSEDERASALSVARNKPSSCVRNTKLFSPVII